MTKSSSMKCISATPPTYFTSVVAKMATEPVSMDLLMETLETERTSMNKHTSMNTIGNASFLLLLQKTHFESTNRTNRSTRMTL